MAYYLSHSINIPLGADVSDGKSAVAHAHKLNASDVSSCYLYRQSVDARNKGDVHFVCSYVFCTDKHPKDAKPYTPPTDVIEEATPTACTAKVIVVGSGPAGLFCALRLAKSGIKVTVIERGEDVNERKQSVERFFSRGELDIDSNVQYGLGGAGTFSDGKLTTGISSPLVYTVFRQLVAHGAPQSILTDALPHIGTDRLTTVVSNIKSTIISLGGDFLFSTTVTDLVIDNGIVRGVSVVSCGKTYDIMADAVVMACGHSARDTFRMLYKRGADIVAKPFAVGVRIEHTRQYVDQAQYGKLYATHRDLPTASYKLVYNGDGHSCYSFCMCPGGMVVAATSAEHSVVVNGMSDYARDGANSNSALVVNVTPQDLIDYGYGEDAFAGVRFQEYLEETAYAMGGGDYVAPMQKVVDFLSVDAASTYPEVTPSYPRGTKECNLYALFPHTISATLAEGLRYFDKKIRGFASHGILTAVESRTSSPIKILRNEHMESNLKHLYPTGEGAGYAGGIVSSAVDGIKIAEAILEWKAQ